MHHERTLNAEATGGPLFRLLPLDVTILRRVEFREPRNNLSTHLQGKPVRVLSFVNDLSVRVTKKDGKGVILAP